MKQRVVTGEKKPIVQYGRLKDGEIKVYEIKDSELEILEKGSPASNYLKFAIFFLSTSFTLIITLLTTTIDQNWLVILFLVYSIIGFLLGIFLIYLWNRDNKSIKKIIIKVKNRLPK